MAEPKGRVMSAIDEFVSELRRGLTGALAQDGGSIGPATELLLRGIAIEFLPAFRGRKRRAMQEKLTADALRRLYDFDPQTGIFTHRTDKPRSKLRAGDRTSTAVNSAGYQRICFGGKSLAAHRAAWLHCFGEWPAGHVDHINGNRTDNRIANLRIVTPSGNVQNQRVARPGNKAGLLGVSTCVMPNGRTKFIAQIGTLGKRQYLGSFDSAEEAHAAYVSAKRRVHEACTI